MDAQVERRSGGDRRHTFLLVPDRRKSLGENNDRRLDEDADYFENLHEDALDGERELTGNYWGAGEEVPPVE